MLERERETAIDEIQPLSRRGFARLAVAGLLATGIGSATLRGVAAREKEAGDDRKGRGRGRDDVSAAREAEPGDDRGSGGGGADDPAGDDRGGRRKRRRR